MTSHETVIYEKLFLLEGKTFKNAGHVSTQVKALLKRLKLSSEVARRAAIVTDGTLVKKPASFVTEELNEAITSSYFRLNTIFQGFFISIVSLE